MVIIYFEMKIYAGENIIIQRFFPYIFPIRIFFQFMLHPFTFILNVLYFIVLRVKDDIHDSFT